MVGGASVTMKAAKLELGSEQTLAHKDSTGNWVLNDPPPNKELELLKCCMSTADSTDTYANNKVTPAAINALARDGSNTMTGDLVVSKPGPRVYLNHTAPNYSIVEGGSGSLWLISSGTSDYANYNGLKINNKIVEPGNASALQLASKTAESGLTYYTILHTGNKPSGSYTGNGDATARTIDTGGIGWCLYIASGGNCGMFVTPFGATGISYANGAVSYIPVAECSFDGGVLKIATTNPVVNGNGGTYYYQVL